jgi:hypothetical protein
MRNRHLPTTGAHGCRRATAAAHHHLSGRTATRFSMVDTASARVRDRSIRWLKQAVRAGDHEKDFGIPETSIERPGDLLVDVIAELAEELNGVKLAIATKDAEIERLRLENEQLQADVAVAETKGGRAILAVIKSVLGIG